MNLVDSLRHESCLTPGQSRSGPPLETDFGPPSPPPPPPPPPLAREWIPRQLEFMSNLPPPSTRLPGAPPPPVLPTHPYTAPRDSILLPRVPSSHDENTSGKLKSEPGREAPQEKYKHNSSSPVRQTKDIQPPPSYQTQGRHEQMPHKSTDRTSHALASDGLKENSEEECHIVTPFEDSRPKAISETIPASWDRPRDIAPPARKLLTLPASLPPKPVAALGDLNLQSSSSLRAGHPSRGRRGQQQTDESNSHSARWGRGDGGRDKDREGNRWAPTSGYQGPSLLARMSSNDLPGRDVMERGREGGEIQSRKRTRRRYQGTS